jgi:hypothetical protein
LPSVNKFDKVDVCGNLLLATGRKVGIPSTDLDQAIKIADQARTACQTQMPADSRKPFQEMGR